MNERGVLSSLYLVIFCFSYNNYQVKLPCILKYCIKLACRQHCGYSVYYLQVSKNRKNLIQIKQADLRCPFDSGSVLPAATKTSHVLTSLTFCAGAIVRSWHENNRPPRPVHPAPIPLVRTAVPGSGCIASGRIAWWLYRSSNWIRWSPGTARNFNCTGHGSPVAAGAGVHLLHPRYLNFGRRPRIPAHVTTRENRLTRIQPAQSQAPPG